MIPNLLRAIFLSLCCSLFIFISLIRCSLLPSVLVLEEEGGEEEEEEEEEERGGVFLLAMEGPLALSSRDLTEF